MSILSDEFYYQPIRIDTINTRVFADLVAKEGDANGRGLLVTLTENGLMKDTTGITLILKWEHTSVGNQGLDNFEAVDPSKGLYKITYPTEMLNRGKVRAFIRIIDSGKLAGTRNIEITVDRGVGDDTAIASSDSFSALASALIEVQSWNARIDDVEQEFIDKANNLDATYPIELNSVKSQLAEVENTKAEQSALLVEKARIDSLNANFDAIGEMTTGTNANGTYTRWPNGFTIARKTITYNNPSGWTAGTEVVFNIGTLPIAFIGDYFTSVEASLYDGVGSFANFKLNISKVYPHAGAIFVEKGNADAKNIILQAVIFGQS